MVNIVTIIIVIVFLSPILFGLLQTFSKDRFKLAIGSIFYNIEFILALLISIYLTKNIFFEQPNSIYKKIYKLLPEQLIVGLDGKDIFVYIIFVPIILTVLTVILRYITDPLYDVLVVKLADKLFNIIKEWGTIPKKIFAILWNIPKAIFYVIILCLILKFYTYYFTNNSFSKWMNDSTPYQVISDMTLNPILNTNIAKQVPVLVNDSFKDTFVQDPNNPVTEKIRKELDNRNIKVIEYFNGVTLDEAIKSDEEIDAAAESIIGNAESSKKKALLLYEWVSKNISYDYKKAEIISSNPSGINSGAQVAFYTKKGICFDYSALYIAMCRAVGLKVRLITGLGYSGISWGDHAWNQVYSVEEQRWIDLDTTFASTTGDYFDKENFGVDHKIPETQGEW